MTIKNYLFDFSDVKRGDVFVNYYDLCSRLGVEPLKGNSRISQMKKIREVLELEQIRGTHKLYVKNIIG